MNFFHPLNSVNAVLFEDEVMSRLYLTFCLHADARVFAVMNI